MPTPPMRRTMSRKSRSVIPAIGASRSGGSTVRPPSRSGGVGPAVRGGGGAAELADITRNCRMRLRRSRPGGAAPATRSGWMAWFDEAFGADYLDLYAHRDEEEAERTIDFVATRLFARAQPRRILDLACGAGRHTAALRRRGCPALGIDLSLALLARNPVLPRVAGDMRGLPVADRCFDWVLNFFTSFGYFATEPENFHVLQEVVRVLEPGGHCLFDLMNLDATLAHLREYEVREAGGQRVEIQRWWDPQQRRVNKRIQLGTPEREPRT